MYRFFYFFLADAIRCPLLSFLITGVTIVLVKRLMTPIENDSWEKNLVQNTANRRQYDAVA